jgi:hypothetical protein
LIVKEHVSIMANQQVESKHSDQTLGYLDVAVVFFGYHFFLLVLSRE